MGKDGKETLATGCKLNIMEAPVARVSSPVRNSRHRDSAPVQPCDQPLGSTLVIERLIMGCSLILNLVLTYIPMIYSTFLPSISTEDSLSWG